VIFGKEGLKEMGEDWERHSKLLEWGYWECRTLIKKEGKNNKYVCILCVILMKNG
jgi:hypothetical protein